MKRLFSLCAALITVLALFTTAEQLAQGINLAADYLDNPFCEPFLQVEAKINQQQGMEVPLVKDLLHDIPRYKQFVPSEAESLERVAQALVAKDKVERDASAAAVVPVKHTLKIEALQ